MASEIARRGGLVEQVAAATSASWYSWQVNEARPVRALTPSQVPERAGYVYGVPRGGLNEVNSGMGASTGTDRRTQLAELYDAYLNCPWAWACVQAIARTITAGGLVMDWDSDTGDGDQKAPEKPANVLAVERLVKFTNPRQNIRQLMRNVVVDLLVFGDAYIEVTWWGDIPVALYNLDNPTVTPITDEHGTVSAYKQVTDQGQEADFDPRDVIHISLDAPRSGVFGVSPTQANIFPITAWLNAAATGKEMFRKGLPPTVHADHPPGKSSGELNRWKAQVMAQNIGPRNIGVPWITQGGAKLTELQSGKVADVLTFLNQKRDEIIAGYGVPPAQVSVIEAGNLGGGTGEEQRNTYKIDVCNPIAGLILEAFNFSVVTNGFGVDGWQAKFRDVDYRASEVITNITDTYIRNGTWTINKARAVAGEPPVEGGDDPVIVVRQNLILVKDLARMSDAQVTAAEGGAAALGSGVAQPDAGQQDDVPPDDEDQDDDKDAPPAKALPPGKSTKAAKASESAISPAFLANFRRRLREAQQVMGITEAGADPAKAVCAQLSGDFPPAALAWVRRARSWEGPQRVPISQIDTRDRDQWDASREQAKVDRLRKKLRKLLAKGKDPKPVILVRWPGSDKDVIADGHHHFLAAEQEGQDFIWAYVGHVDGEHGDWETMAASERGRGNAA